MFEVLYVITPVCCSSKVISGHWSYVHAITTESTLCSHLNWTVITSTNHWSPVLTYTYVQWWWQWTQRDAAHLGQLGSCKPSTTETV